MLEVLKDVPENAIAISATGTVTGDDYQNVLIPLVEEKLKQFDKLRLLYSFSDEFSGYDAAAVWDDTKVGLRHLTSWEKIAVVTDIEWIIRSVKAFGFIMPGEVKLFGETQFDEAMKWISA